MTPKLSAKEIIGRKEDALTTWRVFLWLSVPLFLLDQITKAMILSHFKLPTSHGGGEITVIPGLFNIVRVHNTGMAFGIGNDMPYSNYLFVGIATLAVGFVSYLWRKDGFPTPLSKIAIASLIAGVFGNVADRMRIGYVVDFLDFHWGTSHFPSFNVADSCICIAAGLLIWVSFQAEETKEPAKEEAQKSEEEKSKTSASDAS